MNIDIKLHKNDLPDDLNLGNLIAFLVKVSCNYSNLIVIFC